MAPVHFEYMYFIVLVKLLDIPFKVSNTISFHFIVMFSFCFTHFENLDLCCIILRTYIWNDILSGKVFFKKIRGQWTCKKTSISRTKKLKKISGSVTQWLSVPWTHNKLRPRSLAAHICILWRSCPVTFLSPNVCVLEW